MLSLALRQTEDRHWLNWTSTDFQISFCLYTISRNHSIPVLFSEFRRNCADSFLECDSFRIDRDSLSAHEIKQKLTSVFGSIKWYASNKLTISMKIDNKLQSEMCEMQNCIEIHFPNDISEMLTNSVQNSCDWHALECYMSIQSINGNSVENTICLRKIAWHCLNMTILIKFILHSSPIIFRFISISCALIF